MSGISYGIDPATLNAVPLAVQSFSGSNNSNAGAQLIADAYGSTQITNWTSGTALNTATSSLNTQGMDCVALTISVPAGITGGAITFQIYDGVNYIPIKCARESSYNVDSVASLASIAGQVQGWTVPAAAFPYFRVQLTSAIIGSGTVQIIAIASSAPDVSIVTAGLDPAQALHPGALTTTAQQFLAVGASSVQSAAVQSTTNRVVLSSTTACWVAFGSSPTASAAAGSIYVPANWPMWPIAVTPGVTKIAVIQASAAGSLSIIESV
jgi:hypothetical protein